MDILSLVMFILPHLGEIVSAGFILKTIVDFAMKGQWDKAEKEIMEKALPLVAQAMSNEEKRDKVILEVHKVLPKWFRVLVPFEKLDKFVDEIYLTKVKKKADSLGIVKKDENDSIFS